MIDDRDIQDRSQLDGPPVPPRNELSTADLAVAADRNAGGSTSDLERNISDREVERARAGGAPADVSTARDTPLLAQDVVDQLRGQWTDIQAGFVDEPRQAVEEAGRFVDDLVRQVAEALQAQRGQLAGTTAEGSTEDLRLTLRAYRQLVDRLLGLAS